MLRFVAFLFTALAICDGFHAPSSHADSRHTLMMKLEYRNAKAADLEAISSLCSEAFDGPFQWHQAIAKQRSINEYKAQLSDRLTNMVNRDAKHAMVVAVDGSDGVVGFLEVGMLPSPLATDAVIATSDTTTTIAATAATDATAVTTVTDVTAATAFVDDSLPRDQASIWEQVLPLRREEVPFLGNVAVDPLYRRQGIGAKLVRVGMKVAEKWGDNELWVAVEARNAPAIRMYQKLSFSLEINEEDQINRSLRRPARLFMRRLVAGSTSTF